MVCMCRGRGAITPGSAPDPRHIYLIGWLECNVRYPHLLGIEHFLMLFV